MNRSRAGRKVGAVVGALAFAVASATPASAVSEPTDPHITDPCGDADEMLRAGDTTINGPDEERAAGFDITAAWFENIVDAGDQPAGVRVHLRLCGGVPEPELHGALWQVSWRVDESCGRTVKVNDVRDTNDPLPVRRDVTLQSWCSEPGSEPGSWRWYIEWIQPLGEESYAIDGDRITWTLEPDALPSERAGFLARGATWSSPSVHTHDGRWRWGAWDRSVGYRVSVAGAFDDADDGRDFTVGDSVDAPD